MSKLSSHGPEWERLRLATLDRDQWLCVYCYKALEGDDATADHVVPLDEGGEDALENLVAACRRCNGLKSNKPVIRSTWLNPRWFAALPEAQTDVAIF